MTDAGLRLRPDGTDRGREWEALRKRLRIALPCLALCCLALLVLLPQARRGAMALLNRLYAASEARNRYRYPRFALPEDISVSLALGLIGLALLAWGLWLPCLRARWPVCLTALLLAGAQAYYGLTLPPLLNLTLFAGLGCSCSDPGRAVKPCAIWQLSSAAPC